MQTHLADWIRDNGHRVDPALWRVGRGAQDETAPAGRRGQSLAALDLYDLAPDKVE